ncbi:Protein arginine N-methyltransferase 7 [Pleodorina starrii]|nr:Protein arginine N-methyltransferase 7 [Pleodorina starrii]GLC67292.1 Protein arginine N-methyltransferase 7 [Pleodorina starrii]
MFVQKLNPLTGEADWVLVNDPGLGDEDDASADLVATSSYLDMLTDTRRNKAYHAALRRVIPPAKQRAKAAEAARGGGAAAAAAAAAAATVDGVSAVATGSASGGGGGGGAVRVLDIGTGTGLLAMMAARLLAAGDAAGGAAAAAAAAAAPPADAPPSAPVIACEVFPPMQNLARHVIASNGLNDVIRVVNKRSDEIVVQQPGDAAAAVKGTTSGSAAVAAARARAAAAAAGGATGPDMYGKADVIVTEIFDSELLGEGMIPTMRHAVQHLLKEGGVVIPATSRVYGQLVQCPLMYHMTGLRSVPESGEGPDRVAAATATTVAPTATSSTANWSTAAADRVLAALGELDARARAGFFGSEDLYEVREMHVDLLHQLDEARQRRRHALTHGSQSSSETPAPQSLSQQQQQQQPEPAVAAAAAAGPAPEPISSPQAPEAGEQGEGPQSPPLLQPLSEPFLVFDFDWIRPPGPAGRRTVVEVPVSRDGEAHAVLLWWQLGMTPPQYDSSAAAAAPPPPPSPPSSQDQQPEQHQQQGQQQQRRSSDGALERPGLLLSTAPVWLGGRPEAGGDGGPLEGVAQQWRDHWKQCWVQLADDAAAVRHGDVLRLSFEHDDLNIRSKLLVEGPLGRQAAAATADAPTADAPTADAPTATSGSSSCSSSSSAAAAAVAAGLSAKERLAALQAEAGEAALSRQQLMPLLSWLGPMALWQLGDRERLRTFGEALQAALLEAGADGASGAAAADQAAAGTGGSGSGSGGRAEVVVVDGSLALGLLAAVHPGIASVTLLQEDNLSAQNWMRSAARHLGVPPTKIKSIRSETYFKRLRAGAAGGGGGAGAAGPLVLVSEPYFSEFEQLVPWAHLKFWRDYDVIRGSPAAKGGRRVAAFPRRARLVAVAATLPELWRTRCALGDVEGLNLTAANVVLGVVGAGDDAAKGDQASGAAAAASIAAADNDDKDVWGDDDDDDDGNDADAAGRGGAAAAGGRQPLPILPYSVWQAGGGYEELSGRRELLSLDCGGHLDDVEGVATLTVTHGSVCHAIVLWLEYDLGPPAASTTHGSEQRRRQGDETQGTGATEPGGDGGGSGGGLVVSTAPAADGGPTATVQGVYLLRQPVQLTRGSRLHVAAQFDGLDADVSVEVTVLLPPPLASE